VNLRRTAFGCALTSALLAVGFVFSLGGSPAEGASGCTKVASTSGSDSASGSESAPYKSVQKLVASLGAGQTGCLRQGTYGGSDVYLRTPDVTLQSYPGEKATITAFFEAYPEADRARINHLRFNGATHGNSTGLKLQGDDIVFSDNDVTKGGNGICILAGSQNTQRVVIERNRIYNCGPSGSKYDHQIYLAHTRGVIVRWNILSGNAGGWGVHLYMDGDGTVIEHNVIDGNLGGVVFAGDGSNHSDSNQVRNNAITYSNPRWNVEGSWSGGAKGTGNEAHHNCVYSTGPSSPSGVATQDGFSAHDNTVLSGSPYVNRSTGDYHFRSDSPCASLVGDVQGTIDRGSPPPNDTTPPSVSFRTPRSGDTVSGQLNEAKGNCEALASDSGGIDRVDFFVDGGFVNTDRSSPYACVVDTTKYPNGPHTIKATGYDAAGNAASASVDVKFDNGATAPPEDKALRRPASASSYDLINDPSRANDGDSSTRWASLILENPWWQVDLGRSRQVNKVSLNWHTDYASRYRILTSTDGTTFSQAADVTISSPGVKDTTFTVRSARYVRVQTVTAASLLGNVSIYDAKVFGPAD
jgi:F5/8 type C domain-containing protein/Big-like domain-containing protein/parallel beta helix pectate lyase-like protein